MSPFGSGFEEAIGELAFRTTVLGVVHTCNFSAECSAHL